MKYKIKLPVQIKDFAFVKEVMILCGIYKSVKLMKHEYKWKHPEVMNISKKNQII